MTSAVPAEQGIVADTLRVLSRLKGERIVHGDGVAMRVRITLTEDVARLRKGEHTGVLRCSRALGMTPWDVHGWALRIESAPGGHQDLLLDSVIGTGRLTRRVLAPRRGPLSGPSSSIVKHRIGRRRAVLLVVPAPERKDTLEELRRAVALQQVHWELRAPHPVGTIEALEVLGNGNWIRYDPKNTSGGITPLGLLNRLRRGSYQATQEAEDVEIPEPAKRRSGRSTRVASSVRR